MMAVLTNLPFFPLAMSSFEGDDVISLSTPYRHNVCKVGQLMAQLADQAQVVKALFLFLGKDGNGLRVLENKRHLMVPVTCVYPCDNGSQLLKRVKSDVQLPGG